MQTLAPRAEWAVPNMDLLFKVNSDYEIGAGSQRDTGTEAAADEGTSEQCVGNLDASEVCP